MRPERIVRRMFARLGLRSRIALVAVTLLAVQGVVAMSESRSAHAPASAGGCRGRAGLSAGHGCPDADGVSWAWFDAVLDEPPSDPAAPTWWDLLLCESAR